MGAQGRGRAGRAADGESGVEGELAAKSELAGGCGAGKRENEGTWAT